MDAIDERIDGSESPAIGPATLDEEERWRRSREHRMRAHAGFGLGVALALAVTAVGAMSRGYEVLPGELNSNLIRMPCVGLFVGYNMGRPRRTARWSWSWLRPPQVRTRTLMAVVAYAAILCGIWSSTHRVGALASLYSRQFASAASMADVYRVIGRKSAGEAEQARANVDGLRSGTIPEGLLPGQREFLHGLDVDPKVKPEFRRYRRGLIQDGEERKATMQARNVVVFEGLVAYHEQLAAKYDRARWQPWLPVEPDPPLPPLK